MFTSLLLLVLASCSVISSRYLSTDPEFFINPNKRFKVWVPVREKKELGEQDSQINGHMLKQPLLRFDILWRKFSGKRQQDGEEAAQ